MSSPNGGPTSSELTNALWGNPTDAAKIVTAILLVAIAFARFCP
jgi:hypothetical protein